MSRGGQRFLWFFLFLGHAILPGYLWGAQGEDVNTGFHGNRAEPAIRGLITPMAEATLSATMDGVIQEIFVKDGSSFEKGARLVRFDCGVEYAQLKKAQAALAGNVEHLAVHKELIKLRSASQLDGVLIESGRKQAKAEVAVRKAQVALCSIHAPFSGRVAKKVVNAHESVARGQPLLEIVASGGFEVRVIVPSKFFGKMVVGSRFSIQVDETMDSYPVEVVRHGGRIDPVSQTLMVTGRIVGDFPLLIPGMSGPVRLP